MKYIFVLSLIIAALPSYGQNSVIFKSRFQPHKVYKATMTTSTAADMNFSGNEEEIKKIKDKGITLPLIASSLTEITATTTTGALTASKSVPVKITFGKVSMSQTKNGIEKKEEKPISGLIIEGYYTQDNKLQIASMLSNKMDESTKRFFKSITENLQQQVKYPEKPMQVGDSFDQKIPMQIPLSGINPINLVINTRYTLKEIRDNKARFNTVHTVSMNMKTKQINIFASGKGKGISEYDIANTITTHLETDISMTMKIKDGDLIITANINSKSMQTIRVE